MKHRRCHKIGLLGHSLQWCQFCCSGSNQSADQRRRKSSCSSNDLAATNRSLSSAESHHVFPTHRKHGIATIELDCWPLSSRPSACGTMTLRKLEPHQPCSASCTSTAFSSCHPAHVTLLCRLPDVTLRRQTDGSHNLRFGDVTFAEIGLSLTRTFCDSRSAQLRSGQQAEQLKGAHFTSSATGFHPCFPGEECGVKADMASSRPCQRQR